MIEAYPRPQLKRDSFLSLNGSWDFAIAGDELPCSFPMSINVPYPPESDLSGVARRIGKQDVMWYRKRFTLPNGFRKDRLLLHFGAVDQYAEVYLNGVLLGSHAGGYLPFHFDITDEIRNENELIVKAIDPLDHRYPYGKQKQKNKGIWYTPFSGIWQTVWIESVPETYVTGIKLQPTPDCILVCVYTNQPVTSVRIEIETNDGLIEKECNGTDVQIPIPSPHYWSPSDPYLYAMRIKAEEDTVESYFALRTVSTRVINGIPRLCLNGKPYYLHGVLDQGYWKAGICLPPEDNGYEKDIRAMKDLGFNTLRKHIRIEPLTFYEACDRLGMLVIQDFVNNGKYRYLQDGVFPTLGFTKCSDLHLNRDKKARQIFRSTAKATVAHLYNSPCILGWTIFNEGWGQFCADEMYDNLKTWDPNRFADATSGWFAQQKSDVISKHVYFRRFRAKLGKKPLLLSEFGGYQLSEENRKHFVYRFFRSQQDYQNAVVKLYRSEIIPAVSQGLCGSIYTQLSDVENEINGFLTYDRRKLKIDKSVMRDLAKDLMKAIEESCKEKRD